MVQREIDVLLRAEHPNIIKFHGVVEDKVNRKSTELRWAWVCDRVARDCFW